jgi:aryl-alcohol dehydrogenase-like predicted oxidoreductase
MTTVKYASVPFVSKPVSRVVFGTAREEFAHGEDPFRLFEQMVDLGVTTFDTARDYAGSEQAIGAWLRAGGNCRDLVIVSKAGHPSTSGRQRVDPESIREDVCKSLTTLGVESIDILLLHRDDPSVEVGPIVETLNELHEAGKILAFGGSNWSHSRIQDANNYAAAHGLVPFSVSSPNFGLADQIDDPWGGGCVTISGSSNAAARSWYAETQMPVFAWSCLGRGFFSGRVRADDFDSSVRGLDAPAQKGYAHPENFERLRRAERMAKEKGCSVAQIAMAWLFAQPVNAYAIVSASSTSRMRQVIEALDVELTPEEARYLLEGSHC